MLVVIDAPNIQLSSLPLASDPADGVSASLDPVRAGYEQLDQPLKRQLEALGLCLPLKQLLNRPK